jgi:hypothetical protein
VAWESSVSVSLLLFDADARGQFLTASSPPRQKVKNFVLGYEFCTYLGMNFVLG